VFEKEIFNTNFSVIIAKDIVILYK